MLDVKFFELVQELFVREETSLGERQIIWRSQITTLDVFGNLDFTNQII